ncbi:MAG TPA: ATPase, T2SS/T4P/T4SS family [Candidatus Omnitrophota bacterium]|nr:ATPase, T2SS/T4P/T4SS family [Candidatus Omnitrophota bacterium]
MAAISKLRLGEVLVYRGILPKERLEEALRLQSETREKLGEILVRMAWVSSESLMEVLSAELQIPAIHLSRYKVEAEPLSMIPRKIAELYCLIPVSRLANTLTVAMSDPMNIHAIDDIHRLTKLEIRPLLSSHKDIKEAIDQYYGENVSEAIRDVIQDMSLEGSLEFEDATSFSLQENTTQELLRLTQEEPIVKFTNSLLSESVQRYASDIFIEPEEKTLRVRFRVDGFLQEGVVTSAAMHAGVVSRIKVMSNLDIAEHRIPQDGRIKIKVHGREVDFRVSIVPSYFGEKVVLRVLDKSTIVLDIEKLGFEKKPLEDLKKAAAHPHGMILLCGPTGSGKTTTLYSVLKLIDSPDKNIVTVEDPIEYQMDGINQVAARPEVKLTFAAALRSILRQDPDIIMVGEIRDSETADIAIKAALTGHLVLSTLHTNTAVGAVTRLVNMGIDPYLITSSVLMAGSQRLVRKVCPRCREAYEPARDLLKQLGITEKDLQSKKPVFYRARGCAFCHRKGYIGRTVLLEALTLSVRIKDLILKGRPEYEIKKAACEQGMITLRENGISKILQGLTTPEEVMRITLRDDEFEATSEK